MEALRRSHMQFYSSDFLNTIQLPWPAASTLWIKLPNGLHQHASPPHTLTHIFHSHSKLKTHYIYSPPAPTQSSRPPSTHTRPHTHFTHPQIHHNNFPPAPSQDPRSFHAHPLTRAHAHTHAHTHTHTRHSLTCIPW